MNNVDILSVHDLIVKDVHNLDENDEDSKKWEKLYNEVNENSSFDVLQDIKMKCQDKNQNTFETFNFYLLQAIPLLDEFTEIKRSLKKLSFFSNKQDNETKIKQIQKIIISYMEIVKMYFPQMYNKYWINNEDKNIKTSKRKLNNNNITTCSYCDSKSEMFTFVENQIVCKNCGQVQQTINENLLSFRDIERVNIGSKYSYDRRVHFRECIKRYQGKQNVNIDSKIFAELKSQFVHYQLIPENYETLSKKEAFEKVERKHILLFLKELGYSKYYEDIVYIYHHITGKEIPDISHLENDLLLDFDTLVDLYDKTFKTDRKNFINNQYVLFQLLKKYKYNCKKEDFNFLKTNDRKLYHDTVCQQLFEKLGWNFKALF